MRTSWWTCLAVGSVLTCLGAGFAAHQHFGLPSLPTESAASVQPQRPLLDQKPGQSLAFKDERRLPDFDPAADPSPDVKPKQNLSWLAYYVYSELPPETKPAETILDSFKDIAPGTPVEEIRRVAEILGLDFGFLKAIAKIESGFNPAARTGSYIGLFQLSKYEFGKHGSGDILAARDNAVAAALKMLTDTVLFERYNRRKPTLNDLYLVHQQGIEGATEHLSRPSRLAWRSMCATEEGKQKGEKWCKRAIWGNTLPALKKAWKNVNKITSAAFVDMWRQRMSQFYVQYSEAAAN